MKAVCEEGLSSDLTDFSEEAVLKSVSKTFKSIWRTNAFQKNYIISALFLFFTLLVVFTGYGLLYLDYGVFEF